MKLCYISLLVLSLIILGVDCFNTLKKVSHPFRLSHKLHASALRSSLASGLLIGSLGLSPMTASAIDAILSDAAPRVEVVRAIETVERATDSLRLIQEEISSKGDTLSIISQIKFLLKNSNLKESLTISLESIEKSNQADAKEHIKNIVEYLSSIFEYYSDNVDDLTGKKSPPQEVLLLAQQAIAATDKELKALAAYYPTSITDEILKKLKAELMVSEPQDPIAIL